MGKISKKWSGLVQEAFTDADNFGINFPMDLDVRMKAVLVGACMLIVSGFLFLIMKNEVLRGIFDYRISCSLRNRARGGSLNYYFRELGLLQS